MKIGDIARHTGLTVHTIRYYEKIGLLPLARRDSTGQRIYEPAILVWIAFLGRLKTTGMSIQEMLRYARLRSDGVQTESERVQLLAAHRDSVLARIVELQACLLVLDTKIAGYTHSLGMNDSAKRHSAPADKLRKPVRKRPSSSVGD
ncbi:MerR family transcriptional regulator [Robbsia andropogonis]|uniref:MerR family transcriptional regulator n=1 Tax=Robbsia andropogonis TaxID=28092 RepID=A0A0F5K529_9BURK|nr:MerR family transcriptional regulator [Robbsia andropogonis]KKB64637.1 MerR family transcriptional regulator [Robbsia andropogonis]MCP1117809.1 MerR family transcriptional regulator [Robbsia andropogonis]MCP1127274.1 MerR family transcriptional regulator [Robbsia andropogonis]